MAAVDAWSDVVDLMAAKAQASEDGFLFHVSEHLRSGVAAHKEGQGGCESCRGDVELCSRWESAQEILLTWLMGRVEG